MIEYIIIFLISIILIVVILYEISLTTGYPTNKDTQFQLEVHDGYVFIKYKDKYKWKYLINGYTESRETFNSEDKAIDWIKQFLKSKYNEINYTVKSVDVKITIEK